MKLHEIYVESYQASHSTNFTVEYYLISIKPGNKEYFIALDTNWVRQEGVFEVRQIAKIDPVVALEEFKMLGYPLAVINTEIEFTALLNFGGYGLVRESIVNIYWKELIEPKKVSGSQYEGYLDYDTIVKTNNKRFARDLFRMEIFKRDSYQCRICGSSPDDHVHVRLELHHIKPWEEGGLTTIENLITLCKECHNGIKMVDRNILYKKIGIEFPLKNHLIYDRKERWNGNQISQYVTLTSNCVILRVKNIPKIRNTQ